jgi:hypothetical protein
MARLKIMMTVSTKGLFVVGVCFLLDAFADNWKFKNSGKSQRPVHFFLIQ